MYIPFLFIKVRWWFLLLAICLFLLNKVVKVDQIVMLSEMLFEDRFAIYDTTSTDKLSMSGFIMQYLLFLICFEWAHSSLFL